LLIHIFNRVAARARETKNPPALQRVGLKNLVLRLFQSQTPTAAVARNHDVPPLHGTLATNGRRLQLRLNIHADAPTIHPALLLSNFLRLEHQNAMKAGRTLAPPHRPGFYTPFLSSFSREQSSRRKLLN
jgi:hypothetical protein